jgi:hypothetical protein
VRLGGDAIISVSLLTKKQLVAADVWFATLELKAIKVLDAILYMIENAHANIINV